MKNKILFLVFIFILTISAFSGCLEFFSIDGSTTYEAHATSAIYTFSYGYKINCTGSGKYLITYKCDLPEVLNGQILDLTIHNDDYNNEILATWNSVKSWNITSFINKEHDLGITATVQARSFMISDLNGEDALTIQEIKNKYPYLINQYTKAQSNDTTVFIDPNHRKISDTALQIFNKAGTNNSFILAKELFKWLKQYTTYKTHFLNDNVQTASYTFEYKTGDCDDLSFLYISLCRSLKIPARFIRGFLVDKNNAVPHAWAEVFVGGGIGDNGWMPVECAGIASSVESEVHQNFGIENVEHLRVFKDDGSNESLKISLSGIYYRMYSNDRKIDAYSYSDVSNYSVIKNQQLFIDKDNIRAYK